MYYCLATPEILGSLHRLIKSVHYFWGIPGHFQKAVERAGLPKIRFHDLRTTYASNFVMAGGDVFALSKLLGHTSVEMTAKKYAALHPRFMRDVVETVNFG